MNDKKEKVGKTMARYLLEFQSSALYRNTEVIVYIPTMNLQETIQNKSKTPYQDEVKQYPLLILLSGFGSAKTAWEQRSNIEQLADQYKIALCMVGCENKWYVNYSPVDRWADFINEELPDFLYGNFSYLANTMPRYIAGCSMGGYGALRNYLEHMDIYQGCCALSPATRADNDLENILNLKTLKNLFIETKDKKKSIYLSIGDKDFIYNQSLEFDAYIKEICEDVSYKIVEGYGHTWDLWNREIEEFFKLHFAK